MHKLVPAVLALLVAGAAASATHPAEVGTTAAAAEILFTRRVNESGRPDLYMMAADGSRSRLLVGNASDAAVSSDGRRITFVRDDVIWIAGRDGTGQRRLTTAGGRPVEGFSPAWSPDGTTIYFSREGAGHVTGFVLSIRTDGTRPQRLAGPVGEYAEWCAEDPAPSPDGRAVAYGVTDCLHGGSGGIEAVDRRTGKRSPILQHFPGVRGGDYWDMWGFDPAWSPDGRRIALAVMDLSERNFDRSGIWVARRDGSEARRVWDGSGSVPGIPWPSGWPSAPAWSPDGRWLAFVSDVSLSSSHAGEILLVRADGSALRSVTRTRTVDERDPVWLRAG